MRNADLGRQIDFLRGHPELGGRVARAGLMSSASVSEQAGLGLDRLSEAEFERRSGHDVATEVATAIAEVADISRLRLVERVAGPGVPVTTGRISTHVLDTSLGRPAVGIPITLHEIGGSGTACVARAVTTANRRTDTPLLAGAPLRIGTYELRFEVGAYFASVPSDGTFDVIQVRFRIAEPEVDPGPPRA